MGRIIAAYLSLFLVILDGGMMVASWLLAYWLRFQSGLLPFEELHPWRPYTPLAAVESLLVVALLALYGLYKPQRSISWSDQGYRVFSGASITAMIGFVVASLTSPNFRYSELLFSLAWALSVVLILGARWLYYSVLGLTRALGFDEQKILIVGTNEVARLVAQRVRSSPTLGYRSIGCLASEPGLDTFDGLPVLGGLEDIDEVVRNHSIDEIVIATPNLSHEEVIQLVDRCRHQKANIRVFPDLFQIMTSAVTINELGGLPLVSVKEVALKGPNIILKRAMDIVTSAFALILLSPLMLLTAILIKLTSPGSVFYVQERVGLDGKPFKMLKFRSMMQDAEVDTGPVFAQKKDPRTTPIGALLRRSSLDELPQLINVLLGEMSLVGPRPERPHFVEQFRKSIPVYYDRHQEKAGITGWAQVNGLRGNTSIEERTTYDLWYIENWSIWLDIKIILRSLVKIFKDPNAY